MYILFGNQNNNSGIIEVIFEGKIVYKTKNTDIKHFLSTNCDFILYYDFILYSETINNLTHKRIMYPKNLNLNSDEEQLFSCVPSEIKFVLTEIVFGDKKISVDFKVNDINYYVCDNVLNNKFMMFFLNTHYNADISVSHCYSIEILDQNVNKVTLDSKNNIKFTKTDYCISNE
jgi:hypothetical protein